MNRNRHRCDALQREPRNPKVAPKQRARSPQVFGGATANDVETMIHAVEAARVKHRRSKAIAVKPAQAEMSSSKKTPPPLPPSSSRKRKPAALIDAPVAMPTSPAPPPAPSPEAPKMQTLQPTSSMPPALAAQLEAERQTAEKHLARLAALRAAKMAADAA